MRLYLQWQQPLKLSDGSKQNLIYVVDREQLPTVAGVYVFGRRKRNGGFEALYVGRSKDLRRRIWAHRKSVPLMVHLQKAKQGQRLVRAGVFIPRPGQSADNALPIIEKALIRHFLSEGHDLVNTAGTRLSGHEISTDGRHPQQFIPRLMYVE